MSSPARSPARWSGNFGAKGAIDVALHDLAARRLGVSLPRFLGTSSHTIDTDVTLAASGSSELVETAQRRAAEGFDVLKIKVGKSAADDIEAVTPDPRGQSATKCGSGSTPTKAGRFARRSARSASSSNAASTSSWSNNRWPQHDLDGLTRVTANVNTPVMADESVFGLRDLAELIRRQAADLVNIKLAKCGRLCRRRSP